jgi:hypothetical protein
MRKSLIAVPLMLLCCSLLQAQTVDEIITRNIRAMGGLKRLARVQSARLRQKVGIENADPGIEIEVVAMAKRESKYRFQQTTHRAARQVRTNSGEEVNIPASSEVELRICDGQTSWLQHGNAEPIDTGRAYCPGWLPGFPLAQHEGTKWLKLVGTVQIDGRDFYHLTNRADQGPGGTDYFVDARSYLLVRDIEENNGFYRETVYSDYRDVDGFMFPFCSRTRMWSVKDGPGPEAITSLWNTPDSAHETHRTEKIELNIPLDDSLFVKPEAGAGNAENTP